MARIVVGITGASGIILAKRLIDRLFEYGHNVELVMTKAAHLTASLEGVDLPSPTYKINDYGAAIASGSFLHDGMVVIPCSMATLAAIATGLSDNLLRRAADVTLKERRRLILVPRETPFSTIHLKNMLSVSQMGGIILPPIPAWYLHPKNLADVEENCIAKVFDLLDLEAPFAPRWKQI